MLDVFMYSFNAVMPIIGLIFLGYILRKTGFLNDNFLDIGNKLMFRLCLPCMLYINIYSVGSFSDINTDVIWYSVISVAVLFFIGMAAAAFIKNPRQKGVVHQCVFRSNYAIIGMVLAEALGGTKATAIVGILSAFIIAMFNVLAVISLAMYSEDGKIDLKKIAKNTVTNPLIISVVLGVLTLAARSVIPTLGGKPVFSIKNNLPALYSIISSLSKAASPLALIVLGGKFTFGASRKMAKQIVLATSLRVLFAPLLGIFGGVILTRLGIVNFTNAEFPALVALFGTPVAVSSSVMAGEMDCDELLAGQLVVWTSLASMVTLFVFVSVLRFMGYL